MDSLEAVLRHEDSDPDHYSREAKRVRVKVTEAYNRGILGHQYREETASVV
jgi:hypothetical protein